MWTKGLLLSVALFSLITGGESQSTSPSTSIIFKPTTNPAPVPSCRDPETSTKPPRPKCNYYMVVPFKLTSGFKSVVCTWLKCSVSVTVTVTLEYNDTKATLVSKKDTAGYFECTNFTVPKVEKQQSIFITYQAVGTNVTVRERRPSVIDVPRSACSAQHIQRIYNLGDEVKFRFVCYDEGFNQVDKKFVVVRVLDPNGICIRQDKNLTIQSGVITFSFKTTEFSKAGYYSVQFEDANGSNEYASAQIQEYRLPRFQWKTNCPNQVSVLDKSIQITGGAQYTYGKPVPGTVVGSCCRRAPKYGAEANCFRGVPDICMEFTKKLDQNGNFTIILNTQKFILPFSGLEDFLSCDMTMKEDGTGVVEPSSCYISITNRLANLRLHGNQIGRYYNKGELRFAATLTDEKNNPLAFKEITVQINGEVVKYITTNDKGRAECVIDTSKYHEPNITLLAFYSPSDLCYGTDRSGYYSSSPGRNYPYDEIILFRTYSRHNCHLRLRSSSDELPCYQNHRVQVDYTFTQEGVGKTATTAVLNYLIISRTNIVKCGTITVNLTQGLKGSTNFTFYTDESVAMEAKILIMCATTEDLISDTLTLSVAYCFKNKVDLNFTKAVVPPGAMVQQRIIADPGSFCGMRAEDQAFTLIRAYDQFTPNNIFSMVQTYMLGLQYGEITYENKKPPCIDGNKVLFCNGMYATVTSSITDGETMQDFEGFSLLLASNLGTTRPRVCGEETAPVSPIFHRLNGSPVASFAKADSAQGGAASAAGSIDTLRKNFISVFGFSTTIIGPNGESIVSSVIPDGITTWLGSAFCISPNKGLGLTTVPAKTKTFLSFFVEASLPSNAIRGEMVIVNIAVANYMEKCAWVTAKVSESENYNVTMLENKGAQCVCSKKRVNFQASVTFSNFGNVNMNITASTTKIVKTCDGANDNSEPSRSDTVIISVAVKPEGIERKETSSRLFNITGSKSETNITVRQPDALVPGTFMCAVHVMGDPLTLSIQYFDRLLSTPPGCCEQIRSEIIAIIYLGRYLEKTGEFNEERSQKMKSKLASDFMYLLACWQYDGSFSRYRSSYPGDPWETLETLYAMSLLGDHMFVDNKIPTQSLNYLSQFQDLESGCMNPGTDWAVYLNPYNRTEHFSAMSLPILLRLANSQSNAGPLIAGLKKCIATVDFEKQNTLTQCHLLYAAASSGDWDTWRKYYIILRNKANSDDGFLFWRNDNSRRPMTFKFFPSSIGCIQSTAFVLISLSMHPNLTQGLMDDMARITIWLGGKINQNGGWYSSRDTAAAIRALALYGIRIYGGNTDAQVSVQVNNNEVFRVTVNKGNKFVVQSMIVPKCFGEVKFTAIGRGSILVQVAVMFNTMIPTGQDSAYNMSVRPTATDCKSGVANRIDLEITASFNGANGEAATTCLTIEIFTGYNADTSFASNDPSIKESRMEGSKLIIYIESQDNKPVTFVVPTYLQETAMTYQQCFMIAQNIYTGDTGVASYRHPCV